MPLTPRTRAVVTAGLLLTAAVLSTAQEKKRVTMADLMDLTSIVDVQMSPLGDRVAYVTSHPSLATNQHEAALFVVAAGGGAPKRLAEATRILNTPLPSPKLRWSPDARRVSFLAVETSTPQVYAVDASGGDARALTAAPEGVNAYEWSPDTASIAYLTRDSAPVSVVTHADAPPPATRIALQVMGGGAPRMLTTASEYVESFSWSPDGREIAYAAAPIAGFIAQYAGRIQAVAIDTGAKRTIVERPGMNRAPQYSPDGTRIAFVTTNGKSSLMAPRGLAVAPASGGAASGIRSYPLDDAWVSEFAWARDSKSVFVLASDGTYGRREHMFEQPIVRVSIEDGRHDTAVGGPAVHYALSISRDGAAMAYRRVASRTMGDVVVRDTASGRETTVTDVNPQLRDLALGELKPVAWKSFDGMEIWGLLLTPPGYAPGRRVPMLTYVHGGPGGGVTYGLFPQFMQTVPQVDYYPVEVLASAGFAILFPMPRGGAGYGEAGQRAVINDWGGGDYKDIMTGVDDMIARGVADPDRLGVMGASYGGFMTDWIVTQTSRFKAASAGAAISDLTDTYFLSDAGEPLAEYFGRPWDAKASYEAHSPITFVANVSTPLLIQQGERDLRVPAANAWKFYRALKQLGKTVELDIHPRSSHLFYEPVQEHEAMSRNLQWFTRWIVPAGR